MEGMFRALQELQVQYLGRVIFEKRGALKFYVLNLHVIIVRTQEGCSVVAHERLTELRVTGEWLLAKPRSFPNLPAFLDLDDTLMWSAKIHVFNPKVVRLLLIIDENFQKAKLIDISEGGICKNFELEWGAYLTPRGSRDINHQIS